MATRSAEDITSRPSPRPSDAELHFLSSERQRSRGWSAIKPFVYVAPTSVQEACSFINEHSEGAKFLAGGQSLLPLLKLNLTEVSYLVDLKRIPDLAQIKIGDDGALVVGALATF